MANEKKAKEDLIKMLNGALELEHAARIQYLAHAEMISGLEAEPVVSRLKEIAGDEKKHEDMFREMIGSYLGGVPTMGMAETHSAEGIDKILEVNLEGEKYAVGIYLEIMEKINEMKKELKYEYFQLEHTVRHIILDEQEHISELKNLMGQRKK